MSSRNVLGKGLGSLLPQMDSGKFENEGPYFVCPINDIQPNHYQPRKEMDDSALRQLADSIREKGILQPLVVREKKDGTGYELIAGERRWRAAKIAGLENVPVLVKDGVSKADRLELALIENIQRQNLNPLDEAEAYQRLLDEFNLKQEDVAKRVGKERSTVANTLRILQLPDFAKQDVATGALTMGHARALLSLDSKEDMKVLRDEIVEKGLSVRQVEKMAKSMKNKNHSPVSSATETSKKVDGELPDSYCQALANDLVSHLGTKARILQNGARGKIEIEYYSFDDLERLLALVIK